MDNLERCMTIAYLESYIKEFKRPEWFSWLGFYEQKDRVKRAEKRLAEIKKENLFYGTKNPMQAGMAGTHPARKLLTQCRH